MIKCIIVDDEPLAQEVLENYTARIPQLKLIKKCSNALEAFEVLHNQAVDLMFLDVKMPGINGLDFIRSLKNPPAVIFTTAFAEHAVTGFELDAIDYLLKPITFERFEKAINKLLKVHQPEAVELKDYTYFKVSGQLVKVVHNDLLYAQSVKDYIQLCTNRGNYLTHMTMKYLNELLPSPTFLRVHRSYMVNKACVNVIDKSIIKIGAEIIPVGENYRHNLGLID
ncbi:LytR/AlgR family response regulator transcription factor [Mucilaginibacter terrae]|uniref:DNA-binding LytR/AlgR family response regulator n=1 Tax=Mucilaginibacter terrae TaxID=1955052 RepID=A0ABU3GVA7_9SPHI|nr:LytTR family DNA-binding domain-containing protein [Mucilaginibacter terrae]MDT3403703.1 DNA-binding LytR/AlgR family response regulator [Mucilaginibacter terrae]